MAAGRGQRRDLQLGQRPGGGGRGGAGALASGHVQRGTLYARGGYPWAEGAFNRNDDAPLPLALRHDGTPACLPIRVSDDLSRQAVQVRLRAVLFGAREGDTLAASLNGVPLPEPTVDLAWKDPQIFSPRPQPPSGGSGRYEVDPDQRLLCLEFAVPPEACRVGLNEAELRIVNRLPYCCQEIVLEKLEVHLTYGKRD